MICLRVTKAKSTIDRPSHQYFIDYHSVMTVVFVFLNTSSYPFIQRPNNERRIPYIKIGTPFCQTEKKRGTRIFAYTRYITAEYNATLFCIVFPNPFSPHNNVRGTPGACLQGVFYCVQVTLSTQNLTPLCDEKNRPNELYQDSFGFDPDNGGRFSRINYKL